jgi:hypothetical protein
MNLTKRVMWCWNWMAAWSAAPVELRVLNWTGITRAVDSEYNTSADKN